MLAASIYFGATADGPVLFFFIISKALYRAMILVAEFYTPTPRAVTASAF